MITALIEGVSLLLAFVSALLATWEYLRAGRYRARWREALHMNEPAAGGSGPWRVVIKRPTNKFGSEPHWEVTNGTQTALSIECDFRYGSLAAQNRKIADKLADDLNKGLVTFDA